MIYLKDYIQAIIWPVDHSKTECELIHDLRDYLEPRCVDSTRSSNETDFPTSCAIIFRRSLSWEIVEKRFTRLVLSENLKIKEWAEEWKDCISSLRTLHRTRCEYRQIKKEENSSNIALKGAAQKKILDCAEKIETLLKKCNTNLTEIEPTVSSDPECETTIEFVKKHWQHLTLFNQWSNVAFDSSAIYAQICKINNKDDPRRFLSDAFRAIIHLKITEEEVTYANKKVFLPASVKLDDACYYDKAPSPKENTKNSELTHFQIEKIVKTVIRETNKFCQNSIISRPGLVG